MTAFPLITDTRRPCEPPGNQATRTVTLPASRQSPATADNVGMLALITDWFGRPIEVTWPCMVCRRERPDDRLCVVHRESLHQIDDPGMVVRMGGPLYWRVRYCNDNPACAAYAHAPGPWTGAPADRGDQTAANG